MRSHSKRIVPVCGTVIKLVCTVAMSGILLFSLSGCIMNNDIRLHNKTTGTMVADYYTDEEEWLDSLNDDDEDDIEDNDKEDDGGHRLILDHGESEDLTASKTRSLYLIVMGIVMKEPSSDDITIYNEDVEERALKLYEEEMSKRADDTVEEVSQK